VAGLCEEIMTSMEHVPELLEESERSRHVGVMRMDKSCSRSHSIICMVRT
jgi:centromeric protein E